MTEQERLEMKRLLFEVELILSKLDVYNQQCAPEGAFRNALLECWYLAYEAVKKYRRTLNNYSPITQVK
jgi:hypothetical protein